ncbi:MAG: CPBP family intramembrane metalloprotease [Chlorobium sp.]|uniref:CPBP family intramembrane glutamic endopeptidase n=1 Tax=Chlorobium sp. TaxID=1095 RepID=UPI0025BED775|nr:CPBP family intramembrane glutamic endopeptidase [Chlorobium sp.]MCF8217067.1 CPBP family intramembrane metalloprotease [Chlorobium sp.]MCF8271882.1 CPBP family intramembrane metalloprotease [Chlorobium sp.]MCF8288284.1 CPBP family intramembrane metalloprotease [Chlorobium sp.]MCF8291844.1 CPBP family intramembrane metalloprotease [Chlorobium sp.]MCF8385958.1 CPBP family intramembrane metalloprotease [Chlorobium sp.]
MKPVKAMSPGNSALDERLKLSFGLMILIWVTGLIGHYTPLHEWPALFLYVVGTIALVLYRGKSRTEWRDMYLAGGDLRKSLLWGGIVGALLFVMDIVNTVMYYKNGGAPMGEMVNILVNWSLLFLFPVLVLAEEFLWRGIMFSAMIEKGFNRHLTVFLTAMFYVINHFAVAPVGFRERALMAMMAFPIGIFGGYLVLKTRNVWGSVLVHMITMLSMILDIFIIPQLIF